ncbi:MAG TPA: PBP1A family penicillin-binding protein [Candidatus Paceibacterota bacterium]|nr:PBP1A family penicillin-binding protein [Candidatus Paceibacterota bacterium]
MKRKKMSPLKKAMFGLVALFFLFCGGVLVWASFVKLPDISSFEARKIANSSKITDRTGEVVLYDIHQSVRRTEIPLADMGDNIKNAIISIEDDHFYEHKGIRISSIIRAFFVDILHGSFSQGGSTITQQIIKNTLLTNDKTITRKLKEWILAIKLERHFTKDQILQIYLNDAPFGGTIYGVEEASEAFFNKHAKDLTLAEAAYLASIPEAPTYYSPFGKNRAELNTRKDLVLKRMQDLGYITQDQRDSAKAETVVFNTSATNSIKAPHFVFYILDYLEKKYGKDVMESGGYTIRTTLDYDMQQRAEDMLKQYAATNLQKYHATNSALVAIDPTTGQILTMVGSKDYFSTDIDGAFNVATAPRQPGSSFKPFVYATAFSKGYTPDTVLFDVPTEFSSLCDASGTPLPGHTEDDCYHPSDFDGKFRGPITLRSAIAESRNIPSVKLLYLVGLDDVLKNAKNLGITTLGSKDQYGLSLVLGGGEVTLLDMVSAYGTFANAGVRNPATGILDITDSNGNVVEKFEPNPIDAFDRNSALTLDDVLSDPAARAPTFGSSITIPGVAVKTGTTNDDRDAWILGYTPNLAVGVWSGNNHNEKMTSGGSAVSGPLWKAFMQDELKQYPETPFEKPIPDPDYDSLKPILRGIWMGNQTVVLDKVTGMLATDNTPPESREEKVITDVKSSLYWIDKSDPRGPVPSDPNKDPEYHLWEPAVETWWEANKGNYQQTTANDLPVGYDTAHSNATGIVSISGLPDQLGTSDIKTVSISFTGTYGLKSADVYIDGDYVTTLSAPFRFVFSPGDYGYLPGDHEIKVVGTDTIYNRFTTSKKFTIS